MSIWAGGVVALLAVVLPRAARGDAERRALGTTVWRFSITAIVAVAVLVTTGVLQSLDRLVLVEDLVETPYGIALLAKILPLHAPGEVFYWISEGVPGTGMPPWKKNLSETERWQVIRWIQALASHRVDR